jgi:hypothetical protein
VTTPANDLTTRARAPLNARERRGCWAADGEGEPGAGVASLQVLSTERTALIQRLRLRTRAITEGLIVEVHQRVPLVLNDADPFYHAGLVTAITDLVPYSLDWLEHGEPPDAPIPPAALAQARRAAQLGVSLGSVMQRYIVANARLSEYIDELLARGGVVRPAQLRAHLARVQDALLTTLTAAIHEAYEHQRVARCRTPAHAVAETVAKLLSQQRVSPDQLAALNYELANRWHIALFASDALPERLRQTLAQRFGDLEVLAVASIDEATWLWFGAPDPIATLPAALAQSTLAAEHRSLGEWRYGPDGWRQTHHEAELAWPVALSQPGHVTRCADVTLLAALVANPTLAQMHHETYLAPLNGLRVGGTVACETLEAYIACQCQVASTGARLGVSRRTVEKRLQAIADAIGAPLHVCLPDLVVAIGLERLRLPPFPESIGPSGSHVGTVARK